MRIHLAAAAAALLLTSCDSQNGTTPIKRQPGSWSQKIEVVEFTGPGVTDAQKAQMQQLMTMASAQPVCITPEIAAQEDIEKNMGRMGGQGNCTVAEKKISGADVSFVMNCRSQGKDVRVSAGGTNGATVQDMTVTVETIGAGADRGRMVMKIGAERKGACTPGEFTPPVPTAAPGKANS